MKIRDYYFSEENFELTESTDGVLKTTPIPENIREYYNSENYISHHNQKKSIIEKLYSSVQKMNFSYKLKILRKYYKKGKVLDYGCGNGEFLNYLKTKSEYQLYGYEPNFQNKEEGITFFSKTEEITEQFEIIMLWHVFEHIENREEVLDFLRSKLTKNGILLIAVPNYSSYDAQFFGKYWAAWDVPRHIYHYSKEGAIRYFTQKMHFYLDKIYPLPFDSYYVSILSAKYKNSIAAKIASPFVASISNIKAQFSGNWSSLIYVLKNPY